MRQQPDASRRGIFTALARHASHAFGSPWAFAIACGLVLGWALVGPFFGYSDAWQLVINTGTTIATFLMVFLLQHTQNRDSQALHLKLDEIIRSTRSARNRLIDLEDCTEQELDDFQREFERVRRHSARNSAPGPQLQATREPPRGGGHQPPG